MADAQDSILEQLQNGNDSKTWKQSQKEALDIERRLFEAEQKYIAEQLEAQRTAPAAIGNVQIFGTQHTRRGFLQRICGPLISTGPDRPQTLGEVIQEADAASNRLTSFDIFREPITVKIDRSDPTTPTSTPIDYDIIYEVQEKPRIELKAGTEVGNTEASANANLLLRNLFGGAEALALNATYGTRTRSAYQGTFDTPLLGRPGLRLALGGTASATQKAWASHEEDVKSGWARLRWLSKVGHRHEVEYTGAWRTVTGLASNASPTVRMDAGNSVKSSVAYAWTNDRRDHPLLPSRGYLLRSVWELAGWGPLGGDVAFTKTEYDAQGVTPIPVPGMRRGGVTLTTSLRGGVLYPLGGQASRINDRFQLGGPTDVRGFRMSGLGPRDRPDAVGGDVFLAGGASLLMPVPGVGAQRPLRWQLFLNGGRLLSLRNSQKETESSGSIVPKSLKSTAADLSDGLPSTAAGIGLVYAHSIARFELNVTLPLVLRRGEDARKGLQFGIGINFL